jgi:hypothetical protein
MRLNNSNNNTRNRQFAFKHFFWIIFLLCAGCVNGLVLTTPPDIKIAMDSGARLKQQAEERVRLVKNAVSQNQLSAADIQTIQSSYEAARSGFAEWIDRVQNDLNTVKMGGQYVNYYTLSQNAAQQAEQFNQLVDQKLQVSSRGDLEKNVESFINSGKEFVNTLKEIDSKKRQEIIGELEKLRWQPYAAIN